MKHLQKDMRNTIVSRRRERIACEGYTQGITIPGERSVPLVPFGRTSGEKGPCFCICEIKRRSPSKGEISADMDAVEQAGRYVEAGILNISVLTEEDHFGGTLADLVEIKRQFPYLSVLRKDFLVDEEDIQVSYLAGADAVLLIASVLTADELAKLYGTARALGMECLVEVHTEEDVEKAEVFSPAFVGINSRDLGTFEIDRTRPIKLMDRIGWKTRLVFESGITSAETAFYAFDAGFSGVLVGEGAVRNPGLAEELAELTAPGGTAAEAAPGVLGPSRFWRRLYARQRPGRPLVKICGICRPDDGIMAAEAGADILGFVFADSPRRSSPEVPRALKGLNVLKAAVVVCGPNDRTLPEEVKSLIVEGVIDVIQFHGDETPAQCFELAYPYYKAFRVRGGEDLKKIGDYHCPRVLLDAYSREARGGTGTAVDQKALSFLRARGLWLAGGLGPHNIRERVHAFSPELVDLSSGLELFPGKKDRVKMVHFFEELEHGIL